MFGLKKKRKPLSTIFETADQGDIKVMRVGRSGQAVGPKLDDIERLREAIELIRKRCSKVLLIVAAPGHLAPANLDRFWRHEREIMREQGLNDWGDSLFLVDLAREGNAFRQFIEAVRSTETFVISVLSGEIDLHLFGAALACDYRVVGDDLVLTNRTLKMGAPPGTALPWFLINNVGHGKAKRILLQERSISVGEAYGLHLIDEVVPVDRLEASALETAKRFCEVPDRELTAFKRAMVAADGDLSAYLDRVGAGFGFVEQLKPLEHPSRRWR